MASLLFGVGCESSGGGGAVDLGVGDAGQDAGGQDADGPGGGDASDASSATDALGGGDTATNGDSATTTQDGGSTASSDVAPGDTGPTSETGGGAEAPAPAVTPTSYAFTNATAAKPEVVTFTVYNDCELGTAPFTVTGLSLESPTTELSIIGPSVPAVVPVGGNNCFDLPAADVFQFDVRATPVGATTTSNAVLISIAEQEDDLRVPVTLTKLEGTWTLEFDHPDEFDFSGVTEQTVRSVVVTAAGSSPLIVQEPELEAGNPFVDTVVFQFGLCWRPSTTPGAEPTLIESWPQAFPAGKAMRCDVVFAPSEDGSVGADGTLTIPVSAPDSDEIVLPLIAGQ